MKHFFVFTYQITFSERIDTMENSKGSVLNYLFIMSIATAVN